MSNELKQCPFCGSNKVELVEEKHAAFVRCNECCAEGPFHDEDFSDASVEDWNTREDPIRESLTKLVEEWREESKTAGEDFDREIEGTLLNCADQLQAILDQ